MSPHHHYEIARAGQHELGGRAIGSRRGDAARTTFDWHRSFKRRIVQVVAVLGVCVAAGTAVLDHSFGGVGIDGSVSVCAADRHCGATAGNCTLPVHPNSRHGRRSNPITPAGHN